ncbi:hypothetical protein BGZ83_007511 [Gryganskiella cystojenkinii]|nr:hypothetical protein BGZ83_007511 [Gryganskiella cystojenkinii]
MLDNALDLVEIRLNIGAFLSLQDLTVCIRVCKAWQSTFEILIWKDLTVGLDTTFYPYLLQPQHFSELHLSLREPDAYDGIIDTDTVHSSKENDGNGINLELQRLFNTFGPHRHAVPLAPSLIKDHAHHIRSLTYEGSIAPFDHLFLGNHCTHLQKLRLFGPTFNTCEMSRRVGFDSSTNNGNLSSLWRTFQALIEDNRTTLKEFEFHTTIQQLVITPEFAWSMVELCGHPRSQLRRMAIVSWPNIPLPELLMIWKSAQCRVEKFELKRCEVVRGSMLEIYSSASTSSRSENFPRFWCMTDPKESSDEEDSEGDLSTPAIVTKEAELSKLRRRCWVFVNSSVTLYPQVMWDEESLRRFEDDDIVDDKGRFLEEVDRKGRTVREMVLDEFRGMGPDLVFRLLLGQAPKLRRLVWHLHRSTEHWITAQGGGSDLMTTSLLLHPRFLDRGFGSGQVPHQRHRRWPELESITITSTRGTAGISDLVLELLLENIGQENSIVDISIPTPSPLKILHLQGVGFGVRAFNTLRNEDHLQGLVELDLMRCPDVTGAMLQEVLESCPRLEVIAGNFIRAEDITMGLPWVCLGLKSWRVHIDLTTTITSNASVGEAKNNNVDARSKAEQLLIFERFSTLRDLESLDLDQIFPVRERGQAVQTLDWQMKRGLNLLETMTRLERVRFLQMHSMNMSKSANNGVEEYSKQGIPGPWLWISRDSNANGSLGHGENRDRGDKSTMPAVLHANQPQLNRPTTITPQTAREHIDGVAAFLGGLANVIMQLSHPPVGYGVLESTVDSGKITLYPFKRLRTTLTYMAAAMMGNDDDRAAIREAVNRSHRPVHSKPGAPTKYNAFDPNLQLWVAACLYWGIDDLHIRMHGAREPELAEHFYQYSARLGTTLQMRPELWPADRESFYQYWDENLARRTIDKPVRDYFNHLIDLKMMPRPYQVVFGRLHRFTVTALLPQHLRNEMGMTWTARDERRFTLMLRAISVVWIRLPPILRCAPLNTSLADMRIRRWLGLPLM